MASPYRDILNKNIDKLLTLYNLDSLSPSYGFGDRLFWGWKVSDFANGTFQGGAHALAIALKLGLVKNRDLVLTVIDSAILAIGKIRNRNGSMVEAYPNEHSFCVTALVAFDALSAIWRLDDLLTKNQKQKYLETIRPLINFISKYGEEHAIISNHLATGVAAIVLWNKLSNSDSKRHLELLDIIYGHQSSEGWYQEYEGADPGYQTLCTYYLAAAYEVWPDERLKESLARSAAFLKYFVLPNGTIGGLYGSRNTEVYYPGGLKMLAKSIPDFGIAERELVRGTAEGRQVFPQNIDPGNFIPLINAYAFAAFFEAKQDSEVSIPVYTNSFEKDFPKTGIFIKSTDRYYTIVNYKKGGTLKVYDKVNQVLDMEDGGVFGKLKNGTRFSSQQFDERIDFLDKELRASFYKINDSAPSPFQFIILRSLGLTVFRSVALGNLFKKMIVKMLMTGKKPLKGHIVRKFQFLADKIICEETLEAPAGSVEIGHFGASKAIHMASSGYFTRTKTEQASSSEIVEFRGDLV